MDISEHNGSVDFEKIAKAGVQFIMIRAGYGKNNIDEQFERNIKMCNQLNIPCGVYWFSYAFNEEMAKQEALYCLAAIKKYRVEYPIVYDLEYDTIRYAKDNKIAITRDLASKMVTAFCSTIEQNKYYSMYYSNLDYLNTMFNNTLSKYDLWYARWNIDKPDHDCGLWQYTDKGQIDGVSGSCDLNIAYKDYATRIKTNGLNNLTQMPVENIEFIKSERDMYKTKYENITKELQNLLNKYEVSQNVIKK
jgi:GH25 family lysozyme M1 (1,4-beta-N-acetylmuramidase)